MDKKPFVIDIDEKSLLNLAHDSSGNFGFTFDKTNEWHSENKIVPLLISINEKLDKILVYIMKNGRD